MKEYGVFRPCSPKGHVYSAKFRARAIQLYKSGVKEGVIGFQDIQRALEEEFPQEFKQFGEDRPDPDTIKRWVKDESQLPKQLKRIGVIKEGLEQGIEQPAETTVNPLSFHLEYFQYFVSSPMTRIMFSSMFWYLLHSPTSR